MHQHQLCKLVDFIKITHSPLSLNLSLLPRPSIFSTSYFYSFSVRPTLIFYWKWCSQLQIFFSWNFIEWSTLRLKFREINWISSYTNGWIKKLYLDFYLFIYLNIACLRHCGVGTFSSSQLRWHLHPRQKSCTCLEIAVEFEVQASGWF